MTGAQAAEYVLRQHGVTGVRIEHVAGSMTDHFDPRTNVIRLSDTVFRQMLRKKLLYNKNNKEHKPYNQET